MEDPQVALVLSIVALGVSVVAAVFTGWQAVTAHLQRTRPRGASFTLAKPARIGEDWRLTNTGGSTATDIRFTVVYLRPPGKEPYSASVVGPVNPDQTVLVPGSHSRSLPTGLFVPADTPGHLRSAEVHERGNPALRRRARVQWRDFRGRGRTGSILLW
jgi:hypothetical protein